VGLEVRCEMEIRWDVRCAPNLFLPLGIFNSYVSLMQNKIFFGTLRRISNLTNLAITSWAFSCFLSPGLYGRGYQSSLHVPPPPSHFLTRIKEF